MVIIFFSIKLCFGFCRLLDLQMTMKVKVKWKKGKNNKKKRAVMSRKRRQKTIVCCLCQHGVERLRAAGDFLHILVSYECTSNNVYCIQIIKVAL